MPSSKSANLTSGSSIGFLEGGALKPWLLAARPKTLSAAWVPVLAASSLAHALGAGFRGEVLALALASSVCIQIATNFFNDVIDFRKGADTAKRLGPMRVSAGGLLDPVRVWRAGLWLSALAALLGLPLAWIGGWPILVVGVVSVFLAYGYTGGKVSLAYRGLGDVFVFAFFGLISVWGTYYLHGGQVAPPTGVWVLGTQIGFWATALIAINNGRDHEEDRGNRKMTLAARFGIGFTRAEVVFCLFFPFFLGGAYWGSAGYRLLALLPLVAVPLALKTARGVWTVAPSREWNELLALAGATHAVAGLCLAIAGFFS